MFVFSSGVDLNDIVRAVNQVGAAPGDMVAILEALQEAGALRATAQKEPQAAVKAAAKQFEGICMQMMLKSMRTASLGEGMGDSEETKFYQDMFDQQLSVQLASGKGMGLGLPGSKRLVHEFELQTTPGQGTRVSILRWK
jgi:Rod binding domain-containing protein